MVKYVLFFIPNAVAMLNPEIMPDTFNMEAIFIVDILNLSGNYYFGVCYSKFSKQPAICLILLCLAVNGTQVGILHEWTEGDVE